MSAYSFIIPILTLISFAFYIIFAQRAWRPVSGTDEWVKRSAFPPRMSAESLASPFPSNCFAALFLAVLYGGVYALCNFNNVEFSSQFILSSVCAGLTVGAVFLAAKLLFKKNSTAIFAYIATAADVSLLKTPADDVFTWVGILLAALYIVTLCMAAKRPLCLIVSGIIIGAAAFFNLSFSVFIIFGAIVTVAAVLSGGQKRLLWMFPLFSILLSAVTFGALYYFLSADIASIFTVSFAYNAIDPVYFGAAAVSLIITAVHIFRDRSFSALFIVIGGITVICGGFLNIRVLGLFSGLAIAYSASLIFSRGRKLHKASAIVFEVIICLGLTVTAALALPMSASITDVLQKLIDYWVYLF